MDRLNELMRRRFDAVQRKDWETADAIRDELASYGAQLEVSRASRYSEHETVTVVYRYYIYDDGQPRKF